MTTSKLPSWNVSIEIWNQSCGAISLIMTRWPMWTSWILLWMSTIAPRTEVSVWHLMMSLSGNKARVWLRLYADPVVYKEPSLEVGDTVRISKARRTFKKGYLPHWTEEIFTIVKRKGTQPPTFVLADYSNEILKGNFLSSRITKGHQDKWHISSGENIKEDKETSLCEMAGLSRQVQQLGACERSRVIFHLVILVLFVSAVLLMIFLMKEAEALSFGEDYVVVKYYINSSTAISSSVWWRMLTHALGVVLEVVCPNRKSFTSAKSFWFSASWLLVFIIWPISKEISSCGWPF